MDVAQTIFRARMFVSGPSFLAEVLRTLTPTARPLSMMISSTVASHKTSPPIARSMEDIRIEMFWVGPTV